VIDHRSAPAPAAQECLCRPYPSSQKGGTVIIEEVVDLEEHERRLRLGLYRLDGCPACGAPVHLHDRRPRVMVSGVGDTRTAEITETQRVRCADREHCGAAWQLLPALLARHLWRRWQVVEQATVGPAGPSAPATPKQTLRRWAGRLASSAAVLVTVLAQAATWQVARLLRNVRHGDRRLELVAAYATVFEAQPGQRLCALAGLVHRMVPGVRLM
jgi:hypothetical protein